MDLSSELFTRVVANASAKPEEDADSDQRRVPRVGLQAHATIIPLADRTDPGPLDVQVRDLSASGIGFLNDQIIRLDEQFALLLPTPEDSPAILLCTVAFWQPLGEGLFAIGAKFVRLLRDGSSPLPVNLQFSTAETAIAGGWTHRKAS